MSRPTRIAAPRPWVAACAAALLLGGCTNFAPARLSQDQIGYSDALSQSQKDGTLLNIVRIRYGDSPVFLNTTQVISGYQLQHNVTGGFQAFTSNPLGTFLSGSGSVQLQQSPTFTFQPVTGESLAQSIVRPLSPTELLPLTQSGQPIDVLFRLAVQSVNGMHNTDMLSSSDRSGTPDFFRLLINLRRLQIADLLGVRLESGVQPNNPKGKLDGRLMLRITNSHDPAMQTLVVETRRMLGMDPAAEEAEVVYGNDAPEAGQVAILTRPVLGVLGQVASEVQAPPADVSRGLTFQTIDDSQILHRPTVIVRSGPKAPVDAYSAVKYRDTWYWIAADDFDSKLAFSVVQLLSTLAETQPPTGTVVTIPAH